MPYLDEAAAGGIEAELHRKFVVLLWVEGLVSAVLFSVCAAITFSSLSEDSQFSAPSSGASLYLVVLLRAGLALLVALCFYRNIDTRACICHDARNPVCMWIGRNIIGMREKRGAGHRAPEAATVMFEEAWLQACGLAKAVELVFSLYCWIVASSAAGRLGRRKSGSTEMVRTECVGEKKKGRKLTISIPTPPQLYAAIFISLLLADVYGTVLTRIVWIGISRDADLEDGDFLSVSPGSLGGLAENGGDFLGEGEADRLIATADVESPNLVAPRGFGELLTPPSFKKAWGSFESCHVERLRGGSRSSSVEGVCDALEEAQFEIVAASGESASSARKPKAFAYSLLDREHLLVEVVVGDKQIRMTFKWGRFESDRVMLAAIARVVARF